MSEQEQLVLDIGVTEPAPPNPASNGQRSTNELDGSGSRNNIDITQIIEKSREGSSDRLAFGEAILAVGEAWQQEAFRREEEYRRTLDECRINKFAELGYTDTEAPQRPKQPTVSRVDFLNLIEAYQGRSRLLLEIQDPETHSSALPRLRARVEMTGVVYQRDDTAQRISEYIGMEPCGFDEAVRVLTTLHFIVKNFDTLPSVVPETVSR